MKLLVLELNDDGTVAKTMFLEESSALTLTSKHKSAIPDNATAKKTAEQLRKEIVDEVKLLPPGPPGYDIRRIPQADEYVVFGPDGKAIGALNRSQWRFHDASQTFIVDCDEKLLPPGQIVRWQRRAGDWATGKDSGKGFYVFYN